MKSRQKRITITAGKVFSWVFVLLGVAVSLFPFYWMIIMSTNTNADFARMPPKLSPGPHFIENIDKVISSIPIFHGLHNTAIVALLVTALSVFFCGLAGFTFAKFQFPGKNFLFYMMLATMMVPGQLSAVPKFIMMQRIGWAGSWTALVIPSMVSAFGVFWSRQYAEGAIHDDLLNAARIDGCNKFRLFFNIGMPLLRPGLAFLAIYNFMVSWNDYMWPMIVISDTKKQMIQVMLAQLKSAFVTDYAMIMSGTVIAVTPLIVLFVAFSKQFISNVAAGAIKD